ncbi:MAG: heat-inducible transcriptional repressor HrcA [Acutalibacteraceae bacterium]|nr:MAG: heat-inducible transcription repressor HrcA [Firmicutes bacterium CAG:552_39_19]
MELSERKSKILKAVVDSYIDSCEPISSSEIHDKYLPHISSATIRNELAALEDMGYLAQPHVSAGRIPTADAYRLYVDKLMPKRKLSRSEIGVVKKYFKRKIKDIDEVVRSTAKVISEITNLTSVGYVDDVSGDMIVSVKIVKIMPAMVLFIIVTDKTIIKDTTATISENIDEKFLSEASEFITGVFGGRKICDITDGKVVKEVHREYKKVFDAVIAILKNYTVASDIAIEGSSKLLEQPEFNDVEKAKAVLRVLDHKETLYPVLKSGKTELSIKIGDETGVPECAIVTASFDVDGVGVGSAGVIGPMRMDYSKVVSVLDCIGKTIGDLENEEGDSDD